MHVNRLLVIGVGLIGGSFALALKRAGLVGEVVGVGRSPEHLADALRLGVIDRAAANIREGASGADLVLVATPVGQVQEVFSELATTLSPGAVITDAGSTKQGVVAAARQGLGANFASFVPGHPIAGRERSGAAAAEAILFQGRKVVLTPVGDTSPVLIDRVDRLWAACGAEVLRMTPGQHDAVFGAVSHLPHMLAYALVDEFARRDNADELFSFAAGGFRDFTRIASSSPEMWRDIALNNRTALLSELDAYAAALSRLRELVQCGDAAGLTTLMAQAKERRDAWLAEFNDSTGKSA